MNVLGDYQANGYAHLRGLLPAAVAREYLALLKADIDRSRVAPEQLMRPGAMLKRPAFELYGPQLRPLLSFLYGLTPTMSTLTGRELLPTYSYFRVYQGDDLCYVHSDRFACEHSLSLTLAYSDGRDWPFEIGRERLTHNRPVAADFETDAFSTIAMRPGDAVLYQGIHYRHGRVTPNPNRWSAHMFLHWVDADGPFKDEAFDRRPSPDTVDFVFPS